MQPCGKRKTKNGEGEKNEVQAKKKKNREEEEQVGERAGNKRRKMEGRNLR